MSKSIISGGEETAPNTSSVQCSRSESCQDSACGCAPPAWHSLQEGHQGDQCVDLANQRKPSDSSDVSRHQEPNTLRGTIKSITTEPQQRAKRSGMCRKRPLLLSIEPDALDPKENSIAKNYPPSIDKPSTKTTNQEQDQPETQQGTKRQETKGSDESIPWWVREYKCPPPGHLGEHYIPLSANRLAGAAQRGIATPSDARALASKPQSQENNAPSECSPFDSRGSRMQLCTSQQTPIATLFGEDQATHEEDEPFPAPSPTLHETPERMTRRRLGGRKIPDDFPSVSCHSSPSPKRKIIESESMNPSLRKELKLLPSSSSSSKQDMKDLLSDPSDANELDEANADEEGQHEDEGQEAVAK